MSETQSDLDGPLVDYQVKGTQVELAGMEKVEDQDTYKVRMTMQKGQARQVWINAQTFLEAKLEGQPRWMDGTEHPVGVYFRDYRTVDGLQIPFVLETSVLAVKKTATRLRDVPVPPEKIIIDKVAVNSKFDETLFSKPEADCQPPLARSLSSIRCGEAKTERVLSSILQTILLSRCRPLLLRQIGESFQSGRMTPLFYCPRPRISLGAAVRYPQLYNSQDRWGCKGTD